MGYESPLTVAKINSLSDISGMTVPIQMQRGGSMAIIQPPRSKFMINDILGGNGKLTGRSGTDDDDRSQSPQPRDLSASSMRHHNVHHDDSDDEHSDSSMLDDHSICSGNYPSLN